MTDSSPTPEGDRSLDDRSALEKKLLTAFMTLAKKHGKEVTILDNCDEYELQRASGKVYSADEFILYRRSNNTIDMNPVAHRLADTEDGYQYAKLLLAKSPS